MGEKTHFSPSENNPSSFCGFPARSWSLTLTLSVAEQGDFLQRGQCRRGAGSHHTLEKAGTHLSQAIQAASAVVSHDDRVDT